MQEIDDPELFAKIFREKLIKQFGDIPEVDIVVEGEKKFKLGGFRLPNDADEYLAYFEALYVLFPNASVLRNLKAPEKMSERQKQKDSHVDRRACKARLLVEVNNPYIHHQILFTRKCQMREPLRYPAGVVHFLHNGIRANRSCLSVYHYHDSPQSRGPGVLQEPPRDTRLV